MITLEVFNFEILQNYLFFGNSKHSFLSADNSQIIQNIETY